MTVVERARKTLDLSKLKLPSTPRVIGIETEAHVDWTGNDALRVWVLIDESTDVERVSGHDVIALKGAIHDALLSQGIMEFPYISIAKPSERQPGDDEE